MEAYSISMVETGTVIATTYALNADEAVGMIAEKTGNSANEMAATVKPVAEKPIERLFLSLD